MKCFYHEDREAVGNCQYCGKALCRECASQYTPLSCEDCHREMVARSINEREKEKQEALASSKSTILSTIIKGLIFGAVGIGLMFWDKETDIKVYMWAFAFGWGLPFGWRLTKRIPLFFSNGEMGNFFTAIILNIFKVIISCAVGIPASVFIIVKGIIDYRNAKKL
ncbi:MAG: hypothetical protein K6G10_00430 [Butyrivibrio sp.]|nr:hypothetical protein [Butyrivibrio sp.]